MNYKQKKRIKNTALMVRNVLNMSENMEKINLSYSADLEEFINKIKEANSPGTLVPGSNSDVSNVESLTSLKIIKRTEDTEQDKEDSKKSETPNQRNRPPKIKRPPKPWVKALYRDIMKKCHPDRSAAETITPEEQINRAEALQLAMSAYNDEDFNKLIYAGAIVDVYTTRLSTNQQISILNKDYAVKSQKISEIQSSISWHWGVNWDSEEQRIILINRICALNNINIISKEALIEMLKEHEIK